MLAEVPVENSLLLNSSRASMGCGVRRSHHMKATISAATRAKAGTDSNPILLTKVIAIRNVASAVVDRNAPIQSKVGR